MAGEASRIAADCDRSRYRYHIREWNPRAEKSGAGRHASAALHPTLQFVPLVAEKGHPLCKNYMLVASIGWSAKIETSPRTRSGARLQLECNRQPRLPAIP